MPRLCASRSEITKAVTCAILATVLACCAGNRTSRAMPFDLSTVKVDPLECTTISLKKDVETKRQIIREPSIMQDRFIMAFRYREGGDEKEFDSRLLPGYKNVSILIEAEQSKNAPLVIYRHFSVIEIWKLDEQSKTKLCYQWTISKNAASLKLLLEDFSRRFIAERQIPLNEEEVVRLKAFYVRLLAIFLERVNGASPSV